MISKLRSIDAARGLTVLVMPAVHTVMMYGKPEVHHSWLGYILVFFAEGPGAQLFMFLMGLFIRLGKPKQWQQILKRSLLLFFAGYVLNLFRAVIPLQLGILPPAFVASYDAYPGLHPAFILLLTGDILQLAGMAYGIVSCIGQKKFSFLFTVILFVVVAVVAPFTWNTRSHFLPLDHLLALICSGDNRAFFPLLPWLCYPLAGAISAHFFKTRGVAIEFRKLRTYAYIFFLTGWLIAQFKPVNLEGDFYRSSPGRTIYQAGFVLLWLCLIEYLVNRYSYTLFYRLLRFCSRHITVIYIVQWILICWGTGLAGYHRLGMTASLLAMFTVSCISFGLAYLIARFKIAPS